MVLLQTARHQQKQSVSVIGGVRQRSDMRSIMCAEGGIIPAAGARCWPLLKYRLQLPASSTVQISVRGGVDTVGEEGSIWVDPQSFDLLRLESRAVEIPPFCPVLLSATTVDYAHMRIGDAVVLVAQQATSMMVEDSGVESFNRMDFTHCRSFGANGAIRFRLRTRARPGSPHMALQLSRRGAAVSRK